MRRLAILFAVIAMMSTGQFFMGRHLMGRHFSIVAAKVFSTISRVRSFVKRQIRLLPGHVA